MMVRYFCAAALVFVAVAPQALACVCVERGANRDHIRAAEIVVLGRVVALELRSKEVEGHTVEYTVARIDVERRWKGPNQSIVAITTCGAQAITCTCGVRFDLGGTFILVTDNENQVSSCGLTRLSYPSDDPLVAEIERAFGD